MEYHPSPSCKRMGIVVIFIIIESVNLIRMGGVNNDKIKWIHKKRRFNVSMSYDALRPINTTFPCKGVWRDKAPLRMAFFVWRAALGRILTMDDLRRRILVMDWCCMCKISGEIIAH